MLPLNQAVPGALAALLRSTPASPGKIQFAWNAVVGATVQRVSAVHLEDRLLIVDAATAQWARELSRSAPLIIRRLETLLGPGVVTRMSVRGPTVERRDPRTS